MQPRPENYISFNSFSFRAGKERACVMEQNPVIQTLLSHKSIRKYKVDMPPENVIRTIVRAGQQAPFPPKPTAYYCRGIGSATPTSASAIHYMR
jgi:hypothetical protein